mgnify:CR=1 FL=1
MKYLNLSFLIVFCFIMNVSLLAQDALEPNDTKETAYDITSQLASANGDLTISNLSITANNPDFYKLVVSERSSLKLNFLFILFVVSIILLNGQLTAEAFFCI